MDCISKMGTKEELSVTFYACSPAIYGKNLPVSYVTFVITSVTKHFATKKEKILY